MGVEPDYAAQVADIDEKKWVKVFILVGCHHLEMCFLIGLCHAIPQVQRVLLGLSKLNAGS